LSYLDEQNIFFTIDRFEGNFAVLENRTTGEMIDIPRSKISQDAKESDIIKLDNTGIYIVDHEETKKQREVMKDLMDKINKSIK